MAVIVAPLRPRGRIALKAAIPESSSVWWSVRFGSGRSEVQILPLGPLQFNLTVHRLSLDCLRRQGLERATADGPSLFWNCAAWAKCRCRSKAAG